MTTTQRRCPNCSGPGVVLGALGRLQWIRCRQCGLQYARQRRRTAQQARRTATRSNEPDPT